MKFNKLIELLKEMETAVEEETGEGSPYRKLDPEELFNTMQFLQRCASQAGIYCHLEIPAKERGSLLLHAVQKDNGEPIVAQVKIWGNKEHKIRTRFSLRRCVTEDDGSLTATLPCGEYDAEITCGPEYETSMISFTVSKEGTVCVKAELKRIAHFTDRGWLAGDLHHHSVYSSPAYEGTDPVVETPDQICRSMKSLGMQFGALSDHHNVLNHDEWRAQNHDFVPIVSKEISTSNGHVLQLGVDDDVIYDIPRGKERTNERLRKEFIRICDEIRNKGGLPQVNHPFDVSFSTRYNSEFLDMVEIFQSIEIWNGATPFARGTINEKAFHAWLTFLEQGKRLTATTGSDTHNIYGDDYFGMAEWLDWLVSTIEENPEIYPAQMNEKAEYFKYLYHKVWPRLLEWIEQTNTPSNIHNYVFTDGKNRPEEILEAIREGKSFISNGPLIDVSINGARLAEKAASNGAAAELKVSVFAKKQLSHLWIYTGAEKKAELEIDEKKAEGGYTYEFYASDYDFKGAGWAVFLADGGENNIAVTNPIFIV